MKFVANLLVIHNVAPRTMVLAIKSALIPRLL